MRTHVFVVNDETFPIHLQYLFAGTGAGDNDEHMGLLADIKRVRPGDLVIFYIEASKKSKGGFYGIFKVADTNPVVFHTPGKLAQQPNLTKKLIYRTRIEPFEVYPEGVPEWEALDKLPTCSTQIQWSLIYRKLKGGRGCTPLLPWEAEKLINLIIDRNSGKSIATEGYTGGLDWDEKRRLIVITSNRQNNHPSTNSFPNPVNKIYELKKQNKAYETYLQLYFVERIGIDTDLDDVVGSQVEWFGNEVFCGVGMQKIDILSICSSGKHREYRIIEIKDEPIQSEVVEQIEYYVSWGAVGLGNHLHEAYHWNIQPVIVAPKIESERQWNNRVKRFKEYNSKNISLPILYFEFDVKEDSIEFSRRDY